ncbi:MAG: glycosyltransferase family 2 protein [Micromonosporaceae bacterium]
MSQPQAEPPRVSAVVLAWQTEPWLPRAVEALLDSEGVDVDVVLVDNGCTNDDVTALSGRKGVTVLTPGENLGFAGGCNLGAAHATGDYIALVNSDCVVSPSALRSLVEAVDRPGVGVVVGSVRLAEDPSLVNAGANPIHVLGLSWSGGFGKPETRTEPYDTLGGTGACLLTTAAHWRRLGGFDEKYFAYHEDAELSVRTWRLGERVQVVPDAVAVHRYEFSRNAYKFYLIERNRLMLLATLWSGRALLLLAPPLAALELAMLALGLKQGWAREKLHGWSWLWRHRGHLRQRRSALKAERVVPDRRWMAMLTPVLEPAAMELPAGTGLLNALMRAYWAAIRRLV